VVTFNDARLVEAWVADIAWLMKCDGLPVMKPVEFDRIDVDVTRMDTAKVPEFTKRLAEVVRNNGRCREVWRNGAMVSVSEPEEAG
jgi:hypothetical protein